MRILIVEDDENKRNQLVEFIKDHFSSVEISVAKSFQTGLKAIIDGGIDLILLDMTMPTFDIGVDESGGRPQAYAGREILRQMNRRKIKTPVTVITQFDKFGEGVDELTVEELNKQLHRDHSSYMGTVYYNASLTDWKQVLFKIISSLLI